MNIKREIERNNTGWKAIAIALGLCGWRSRHRWRTPQPRLCEGQQVMRRKIIFLAFAWCLLGTEGVALADCPAGVHNTLTVGNIAIAGLNGCMIVDGGTALSSLAPLASPTFTGTVTMPGSGTFGSSLNTLHQQTLYGATSALTFGGLNAGLQFSNSAGNGAAMQEVAHIGFGYGSGATAVLTDGFLLSRGSQSAFGASASTDRYRMLYYGDTGSAYAQFAQSYVEITSVSGGTITGQYGFYTNIPSNSLVLTTMDYLGVETAGHVSGNGTAPTKAAGTGAGTSPTITLSGSDVAFRSRDHDRFDADRERRHRHGNFHVAYTAAHCVASPTNAAAAALTGTSQVYGSPSSANSTTWVLTAGSAALAATTTYDWTVSCSGP